MGGPAMPVFCPNGRQCQPRDRSLIYSAVEMALFGTPHELPVLARRFEGVYPMFFVRFVVNDAYFPQAPALRTDARGTRLLGDYA